MLDVAQYAVLKKISRTGPSGCSGRAYLGKSKLAILLGAGIFDEISGRTVIDFGCGDGAEAVEMASQGAGRVIGIDNREEALTRARLAASQAGVSDICEFRTATKEKGEVLISLDCFEHFEDPAGALDAMHDLLIPGGSVLASFGPTWYHPYGGHLFSVFPWAHLIFSERALIRWRADIRNDGATRFGEVEGGLNQMTIRRFERIVTKSRFQLDHLEAVPINRLRWAHNKLTREFTTAIVRCRLRKPA